MIVCYVKILLSLETILMYLQSNYMTGVIYFKLIGGGIEDEMK